MQVRIEKRWVAKQFLDHNEGILFTGHDTETLTLQWSLLVCFFHLF